MAVAHLYLANIGLAGIVAGFMVQPHNPVAGRWILSSGGVLFAIGVVLWAWNLWQTFSAADARERARAQAGQKSLPTVER
jgi:cbb3-type cytochrome oxidase subunit 1